VAARAASRAIQRPIQSGNALRNRPGRAANYAERQVVSRVSGPRYPAANSTWGFSYETGQVVPQDFSEAVKWYLAAAEQELGDAQCNLGLCYQTGAGGKNAATASNGSSAPRAREQNRQHTWACTMPPWKPRRPPPRRPQKTSRANCRRRPPGPRARGIIGQLRSFLPLGGINRGRLELAAIDSGQAGGNWRSWPIMPRARGRWRSSPQLAREVFCGLRGGGLRGFHGA